MPWALTADAVGANLQREPCLSMGGRRRKSSASVSGPVGVLTTYRTLSRSLLVYHHARCWQVPCHRGQRGGAEAAVAELPCEQCLSMGGRRRNGGASVSGANGVHEAPGTLNSSFTLRHHAWMQAIPVSQESCVDVGAAAAELPLGGCCICARCARNGGASDSAAHGAHEGSETLSSSLALRNNDQAQANAVSQRAALVLMPRSLIDSVSNAYRWAAGAENPARLFQGQLVCLQRMGN